MPYITLVQLKGRLPREGEGLSDDELNLFIESAVEKVKGLTGDEDGFSALARSAAANLAEAKALDIIFPHDARSEGTIQAALRASAGEDISHYLEIKRNNDNDPTTTDVPPVRVTVSDPYGYIV